MTTAATSLLGLALPVTGELSGTWGDTVNNSITALLDSAVAGTTTLSADADVTLTTTTLAANQAREAIILWTAAGTVTRYITAPAQSKIYAVLNKSSTQSIVLRGVGPTTGVTILAGKQAMVAWDGADYVEISSGYVDGPATSTDNAVARFDGTDGKLLQNSVVIIADTTGNMTGVGTLSSGAITSSSLTATRVLFAGTSGLIQDDADLTFNGTILTSTGFAGPLNGTVGATTANTGAFTTLTTSSTVTINGGTANGVAYLDGSKVLTTGSALTFDSSNRLVVGAASAAIGSRLEVIGISGQAVGIRGRVGDGIGIISWHPNAAATEYARITSDTSESLQFGVGASGTSQAILNSSGLEVKQSQLIGYSSYAGIGTNGLAVAGNVGIGTSSPAYKLDVTGTINSGASTATGFNMTFRTTGITTGRAQTYLNNTSGDFLTGIEGSTAGQTISGSAAYSAYAGTFTANPLYLVTNATIKATLDSAGNLGLGVTPSAQLAAYKSFQFGIGGNLIGRSDNAGIELSSNSFRNTAGTYSYLNTDGAAAYRQYNGAHEWYNAPSGTAGNPIAFTQAMTLDAGGNLVIGDTSTSSGLTLVRSGSTTAELKLNQTGTGGRDYRIGSTGSGYGTAGKLIFYDATAGAERMCIDASGNLGLGVTPSAWVSGKAIQVNGGASLFCDDTTYRARLMTNAYYGSGGYKYIQANSALMYVQNSADRTHAWLRSTSAQVAETDPVFDQAMTLDASGNLNVGYTYAYSVTGGGTTKQTVGYDQNGRTQLAISNQNAGSGASASLALGAYGADWIISCGSYAKNANSLTFGVGNNDRMTLDASGNLSNTGTIGFGAAPAALRSSISTNITAGSSQVIYGTVIAGNMGAYMMVKGVDASGNWFVDFLTFLNSNAVTLLAGMNGGSPGSRTYAVASGTLSLNPSVTQTSVRVSASEV